MDYEVQIVPLKQSVKIFQYILDKNFYSKKINIKDTILISGAPRSGTTWLMDIVSSIPNYTYLFEPANPKRFPQSWEIGFNSRTFVPADEDWFEGENYLRKAFSGGIASLMFPPNQLKPEIVMHRLLGNKLVVKFTRCNRMLPWIVKRFELRHNFFIIRHPCAVIASNIKNEKTLGYHPPNPPFVNIFPSRNDILDEASKIGLDDGLMNKLKKIETTEEILAAVWCLDNYVPLSLPRPYPWTVLTYEKLMKDGEKEINRIFNELGEKTIPKSTFKHLRMPSMAAVMEFEIINKADEQLSKWKKFLSEKQVERILRMVSNFGLDFYTEDIEPDYDNITAG